MNLNLLFDLTDLFTQWGLDQDTAHLINTLTSILFIILLAYVSDLVTKKFIVTFIKRLVVKTSVKWDDIILQRKVFERLSHLAPAIVLYFSIGYALQEYEVWVRVFQTILAVYMILICVLVLDSFANALHDIYTTLPISDGKPIKGFIQAAKLVLYIVAIFILLSVLLNKNIGYFITGLGAITAVLLLVFKDTILGFVAGIQISANNMVKVGDWISMPSHGADGPVIDITLNTVKVQNWDKTISTIPTYAMVSESFTNWRGMEESGGRRIMRYINIDMKSVRFLDQELRDRLKKIQLLKSYIEEREAEIEEYNKKYHWDEASQVNGRRLTNLGTFRKYLETYLKQHPKINNDMTFLVRHLQPTEKGIPIQIYVFCKDQQWAKYEAVQADIFDHIISITDQFDLRIFQSPSGDDLKKLILNLRAENADQ